MIIPNNFEVGDYVLYKAVYGHAIFTYQILRINGNEYSLRYISHVGQSNVDIDIAKTNIIKLKHLFMKNHMTKIKNYEKSKN